MLKNIPPVTKNILLINVVLFLISMLLLNTGTNLFGILSAHYITSIFFEPYQVVTHMFMHSPAGFGHIFFNMFSLVIFGSHLERIWGPKRLFIFYIASGLGAFLLYNGIGIYQIHHLKNELLSSNILQQSGFQNLAEFHTKMMSNNDIGMMFVSEQMNPILGKYHDLNVSTMLGASGAIFGLLAGFGILFPNTEMQIMLIPVKIKAKYLIGGYIAYEVFNSLFNSGDHIAHIAHVGGAIVGAAFVLYWRKYDKKNFY